jgi:photosystem II stability/assembly factor-like uncharacterized protein
MQWTHFPDPASTFALAAVPTGGCLAATTQGAWQYTPHRKSWEPIATQFAQVALTAIATHDRTWLVGSNGDIAVSRDGGATWGVASLPVQAQVLALAMSPAFDRDGLALAGTARDGVLRTTDRGVTWHAWNYGLLDLGVNAIELSPRFDQDATCFAASDHAIFMSTNGGRAWQELGVPAGAGPFTALACTTAAAPVTLLCGTEGNGLWASKEPYEAWRRVRGLRAEEINVVLPCYVATTAGVYASEGGKWRKLSDNGDVVSMVVLDDGTLVAGTAGAGMWHGA